MSGEREQQIANRLRAHLQEVNSILSEASDARIYVEIHVNDGRVMGDSVPRVLLSATVEDRRSL